MATLESSLPRPKIRCRLRQLLVAHTPEEEVRQNLISYFLDEVGVPKGWMAIELALSAFAQPHLKAPSRRIDLLILDGGNSSLKPLLLVECKAIPLNKAAERQLLSYNCFVQAPYVCLANQTERRFGEFTPDRGWVFSDRAPRHLLPH